jgi:hypothetical protein
MLSLSFFGGFVISLHRLLNKSHPHCFRRYTDAYHSAANDRPYLLQVRLKPPSAYTRNLPPDAAEVLRLAAPRYRIPEYRLFTRQCTYSRHFQTPVFILIVKLNNIPPPQTFATPNQNFDLKAIFDIKMNLYEQHIQKYNYFLDFCILIVGCFLHEKASENNNLIKGGSLC